MAVHHPTKQPGNLPPQGKQAHEQANVIQLRSGTTYQNPEMPINEDEVPYMHPKGLGNLELSDKEKEVNETETRAKEAELINIALPFPHRQQKSKMDKQFGWFIRVVKNLQVSVPFTELITQVSAYAKFMKEILTRKRSFDEVETVAFTQKCSTMADRSIKLPLGVLEDVPVRVGKFFIPVDFFNLDMAEDTQIAIILGILWRLRALVSDSAAETS
ncbi:uncharacterized protein LOC141601032 [Silene latifolia]|uniref:uncharacterized protein LOC141601032 n=1 Tax=Silene latifolia TaxID=37657 RepID=UPI003D76B2FB